MGYVSSKREFWIFKDEIWNCALESLNQVGMKKDYANKR